MSYARQRRRFEIERLADNVFVWTLKAGNQVVMLRSPRTYNKEANARRAIKATRSMLAFAGVVVVDRRGKKR